MHQATSLRADGRRIVAYRVAAEAGESSNNSIEAGFGAIVKSGTVCLGQIHHGKLKMNDRKQSHYLFVAKGPQVSACMLS
jgi:hypothetical protein